jgi:signal transduction histidine kinase
MERELSGADETQGAGILIVEDSPTQAAQLRHILETHGYRVVTAGCGKEALALLPEEKPDLMISDIIMPEMDGYELCRRVKDGCVDLEIPVMLLTSLADPHDVISGLECGADAFITKPFQEEHFLARVRYLLQNRHQCRVGTAAGLTVEFAGRNYQVTSDRRQILDLLLSTYETAIEKNNELLRARNELSRLNEQLATANRELEAFNSTVSHDLRTPLSAINGFSQVILELYGATLDPQCREFVADILQSTLRMDRLIGSLLRFSSLGRRELERTPVHLSAMVKGVATDLRRREPHRTVQFTIAEGVTAEGDPVLLQAVLENLIGNAWKYSGKKEAAEIEFGVTETAGERIFFVRDNGAGFAMDDAHRLFGAFERLHNKDEFEGTGIGLATVQRIIQRHGGRIWAEGALGEGATFYFTL